MARQIQRALAMAELRRRKRLALTAAFSGREFESESLESDGQQQACTPGTARPTVHGHWFVPQHSTNHDINVIAHRTARRS